MSENTNKLPEISDLANKSMIEPTASMPAAFGTRFLTDETAVFEFNAWDNVQLTEEDKAEAEKKIATQKQVPITLDNKAHLFDPRVNKWDEFYVRHDNKFFKNRKWLFTEFPGLLKEAITENKAIIMEIGCGVGNALLPLVENTSNPNLRLLGCDISSHAINLIKRATHNDPRVHVYQCDISKPVSACSSSPLGINAVKKVKLEVSCAAESDIKLVPTWNDLPVEHNSIDYATLIFVLSAIPPSDMESTMRNIYARMKPGGILYYRDYAKYDLTQLRFKKNRYIDENFYCRGDGTFVTYMDEESCTDLFTRVGFKVALFKTDNRLLVNRKDKTKMYRMWLQCELVK